MSFNLSQLGQIAQGEGSKKPGPKPRMAMPKKKKKKGKSKGKTLPTEEENPQPVEVPSAFPPLPPFTPQEAGDLSAPVTQPPVEKEPTKFRDDEEDMGVAPEGEEDFPGGGRKLSAKGGGGEDTSKRGTSFSDERRTEGAPVSVGGSSPSTTTGKRKQSQAGGPPAVEVVEEVNASRMDVDVDVMEEEGGDEMLSEKVPKARKEREVQEGVNADAKASKKSKKRKSKEEDTKSKKKRNTKKISEREASDGKEDGAEEGAEDSEPPKKKKRAKKKPEKDADGKEKNDDSEEPSASKSAQVEKKKKKRKNTRQEELERLLAVKDISTLPLCDIVARVNYEELRNKKKEALKKKEKEGKNADAEKTSSKVQAAKARGGVGSSIPSQVLAPQVTVVDGKIVLNQESLEVAGKGAAGVQQYERVEEGEDRMVNTATYSNWTKPKRWTVDETHLFYQCVKQFGTDFTLLETLVPGRTRQQLREKYKREAKKDPIKFHQRLTPGNAFDEDFGMEDHELYQKLYEDLKSKRNSNQQTCVDLSAPSQTQGGEKSGKEGESTETGKEKEASQNPAGTGNQTWGQGNQDLYGWDDEEDYFY